MYYVCERKGNKFGVKDTKDGVVEYYTEVELRKIQSSGLKIVGVDGFGIVITGTSKDFLNWFYNKEIERIIDSMTSSHVVKFNYDLVRKFEECSFKSHHTLEITRVADNGDYREVLDNIMKSTKWLDRDRVLSDVKLLCKQACCTIKVECHE